MNSLSEVLRGLRDDFVPRMSERLASVEAGERVAAALDDERLRVGLVGEFNSGKSTLINALYRREAAATDILEMTSWVATYRLGSADTVTLVATDGSATEMSFGAFLARCERRAWVPAELASIERVDITLEGAPIDATLVDSPGLGAVTRANEARLTRALALADAVLWTVDIEAIGDLREAALVRQLRQSGTPIVPVLTKADLVQFDSASVSEACRYLAEASGNPVGDVHVTGARRHLKAADDTDGVDRLREYISDELVPNKAHLRRLAASAARARVDAEVRALLLDARDALRAHRLSNDAVRDRVRRVARAAAADGAEAARAYTRKEFLRGKSAVIAQRLAEVRDPDAETLGAIVEDVLGKDHLPRFWSGLVGHVSDVTKGCWDRWLHDLDGGLDVEFSPTTHGTGRDSSPLASGLDVERIDDELATSLKTSLGTGAAATAWFAWLGPSAGLVPLGAVLTTVGLPVAVIGGVVSYVVHKHKKAKKQLGLAAMLDEELPNQFIEAVVEPVLVPALDTLNEGLASQGIERLLSATGVPDAADRLRRAESLLADLGGG